MNKSTDDYTALTLYNFMSLEYSHKHIPYVIVEGETDLKLFSQRCDESKVRFKPVKGKKNVRNLFKEYKDKDCIICFVQDLDTDFVTNNLHQHSKWVYNCYPLYPSHYNDIEVYLINTDGLNRVLTEYIDPDNITSDYVHNLRLQLEKNSRIYDAFFHAYSIAYDQKKLSFNNIKPTSQYFFEVKGGVINFDIEKFKNTIHTKLNLSDDEFNQLVQQAEMLNTNWPALWSLSRGHTITAMLASYLSENTTKNNTPKKNTTNNISSKDIEKELRLAADNQDLKQLPFAKIIPFKD